MTAQRIRDYQSLRRAIIARRQQLGWSQAELADAAGLPFRRVRQFEAGRVHLDDAILPGLLGALRLELYAAPRARAA